MDDAFFSVQIKSYLDVYDFLQDAYHALKKESPGFTYEAWATELNISSRSYLREAIYGKRKISEELTQKLCDFFKFQGQDRDYFVLLVQYTQSSVPEQKKIYGRQLTDILKNQPVAKTKIEWESESTSTPLSVVVRDLLSFKDFKATLENFQNMLGISAADLRKILKALEEESLIEHGQQQWRARHDYLKIEDKPRSASILHFHERSLHKAIEALASPAHERYYRSLTVALSEEQYAIYIEEMKKFIERIFSQFGGDLLEGRRIYQLNLSLLPWTQTYQSSKPLEEESFQDQDFRKPLL